MPNDQQQPTRLYAVVGARHTHTSHFELLPGVLNENPSPLPGEGPLRLWPKLLASPVKNVWNWFSVPQLVFSV